MKRLFIAISCTLLLFASKASASKSRCPMQHADSITVFGVLPDDEYVKMLNALSSPFSTLDFTMDRNGCLLLDPLKPSDDEFNF